jgi:hypothetical protein
MVSPATIGEFAVIFFICCQPLLALHEYRKADHPGRLPLIGLIAITLMCLLAVSGYILVTAHIIHLKQGLLLPILFFDLAILINIWTSPAEAWVKRRHSRRALLIMIALTFILLAAFVLVFV